MDLGRIESTRQRHQGLKAQEGEEEAGANVQINFRLPDGSIKGPCTYKVIKKRNAMQALLICAFVRTLDRD